MFVDYDIRSNFNFLVQQLNCLDAYWIDHVNRLHVCIQVPPSEHRGLY